MSKIKPSGITPERLYFSRRQFVQIAGAAAASAAALAACRRAGISPSAPTEDPKTRTGVKSDELGHKLTSYEAITNYNNFYEFSLDKEDVATLASGFQTRPWTIKVGGLVDRPKTYDIDDILRRFGQEERVYRLRCVEGWSMVIPWLGFPLAKLLKDAEPMSKAKYVRFTSLLDPEKLPGQKRYPGYDWPYVEGLRLDEALHNLTFLAEGLYGRPLPAQNGAPLRLVVPWKYGFKSVKSIVRIDLVEKAPVSLWMKAAPGEYGFYANVNPDVPHPRWPQSSERPIGEFDRRKTLSFNGYGEEVASLYKNMDLKKYF